MKITSYPENLNVIIRTGDSALIFSKNPNFITPIIKLEKGLRDFVFSITRFLDEKTAETITYEFTHTKEECEITTKEKLITSYDENGLIFKLNGKSATIDEIKDFVKSVGSNESFCEAIKILSFNSHTERLGFKDIYLTLRSNYTMPYYDKGNYAAVVYYYYYSKPEMYAVAERLIKLGMESDIDKYNPLISHKPIPDVSSIKTLSKVSMQIIKELKCRHDDLTSLFANLEENPNIGVNGIKMIKEMCDLYGKIYIPYNCECDSFSIWRTAEVYEGIDLITKQFNITVKNLINRIIKASFYENLSPLNFVQLVTDYVRIAKLLEMKIPEKMPKDIVKDHDLLSAQYQYVKDKITETHFKEKVKQNKLLLDHLPESKKFTIISPENPNDLIEEGLRMHHCVGTYVNRYASGSSKIFFLRNKVDLDAPCVTIELNKNNSLVQARSFANSNPSKEISEFIDEWLTNLK